MSKKGQKAVKEVKETSSNAKAPSEVEFVSSNIPDTDAFFESAFGWTVKFVPEWKMATVNWGLKMTGMVREEADHDKGRDQRTIFYMTVPDIDKEYKRLKKLGADTFKEPTRIPGMGAWGYVKVPGDLLLGLWSNDPAYTPPERKETKEPGGHGTASFFEIVSPDLDGTRNFFNKAYNWEFGGPYTFIGETYWYCQGDKSFSVGFRGPRKGEKGANCLAYFNADSLANGTKASVSNGAKKVGGVLDYSPHGDAQMINVPGKIPFGLWTDKEMAGAHGGADEKGEEKAEEKPDGKAKAKAPAKKAAASKAGGRKTVPKAGAAKKKAAPKKKTAPKAAATKKRGREEAPKESKRPTKRAKKE